MNIICTVKLYQYNVPSVLCVSDNDVVRVSN